MATLAHAVVIARLLRRTMTVSGCPRRRAGSLAVPPLLRRLRVSLRETAQRLISASGSFTARACARSVGHRLAQSKTPQGFPLGRSHRKLAWR
jgi:hypothetical protein